MRIERFAVRGYKNLVEEIVLDDLGDVNVIHGDNDVGKSNLLEAIDLAFHMLAAGTQKLAVQQMESHLGFPVGDAFTIGAPTPIVMRMRLAIDPSDFRSSGVDNPEAVDRIDVVLTLAFENDGSFSANVQAQTLRGQAIASWPRWSNLWWRRTPSVVLGTWFEIIGLSRRTRATGDGDERDVVSPDVCLALFEASNSDDARSVARWNAFAAAAKALIPALAGGEIRALYSSQLQRARLSLDRGGGRVPTRLIGAGLQHALAVLGWLSARNADIVAIEEPEVGLRYTNQLRLAQAIRSLVDAGAPKQVFIVSHSPAFEVPGQDFYAMTEGPTGPMIQKLPAHAASAFVDMPGLGGLPGGTVGAVSYVTSEGLVKVPSSVLAHIGLPSGGGVIFDQGADATATLISSETWATREGHRRDDVS